MPDAPMNRTQLAAAFWGAVLLSVIVTWVPGGQYALYPFVLLGTWAHELGHGLAALALGGGFDTLEFRSDFGGVAHVAVASPRQHALVSAAGLLGPAFAGGLVIVLGARPRLAPRVLAALGVALAVSLAVWIRTPFGVGAIAALAGACLALAVWAPLSLRVVFTQLVGIQLCFASMRSFDYMFTSTFERDGQVTKSDTQNMADALGLAYWVWGSLVFAVSLSILALAFWFAWMRDPKAKKR